MPYHGVSLVLWEQPTKTGCCSCDARMGNGKPTKKEKNTMSKPTKAPLLFASGDQWVDEKTYIVNVTKAFKKSHKALSVEEKHVKSLLDLPITFIATRKTIQPKHLRFGGAVQF